MNDGEMTEISVLLIDSSRLFREGIRRIFVGSPFRVVQESSSIEEALPLLATAPPALILIDVHDAGNAFKERLADIRAAAPAARIVVLTETVRVNRLADALSAGVDGYLVQDMSADALQQSLHLVLLGEKVFPTDLAHLLTNGRFLPRNAAGPIDHYNGLSEREMQILGCLLNGASNKRIANQLDISEGTVKVHLKAVLKKINVQNRTQAAIWALNHGIAGDICDEQPHKP
jgi:two-component system nitrate/nitrite response regulator NarL